MEKIVVGIFVLGFTMGIKTIQKSRLRALKKYEVKRVIEPVHFNYEWNLN